MEGGTAELGAVVEEGSDAGVEHGDLLLALADAQVTGGDDELAAARARLREVMGDAALLDAVGVVSNFERMNRIADATGIPLDAGAAAFSADVRAELGIDGWSEH